MLQLGWSDKTVPTILELANAFESDGGGIIVVLSVSPLFMPCVALVSARALIGATKRRGKLHSERN